MADVVGAGAEREDLADLVASPALAGVAEAAGATSTLACSFVLRRTR